MRPLLAHRAPTCEYDVWDLVAGGAGGEKVGVLVGQAATTPAAPLAWMVGGRGGDLHRGSLGDRGGGGLGAVVLRTGGLLGRLLLLLLLLGVVAVVVKHLHSASVGVARG